jgi:hypothetical protein
MRYLKAALVAGALFGVVGAASAVPEVKTERTFKDFGHVHGYFINAAGEGLNGVVALRSPSGRVLSLHDAYAHRKGRFDIDNLLPGRYRLSIESPGTNIVNLPVPDDIEIEVLPKKVVRPRIVAQ